MGEKGGESFYTAEDLRGYVNDSEEYTAITGRDRVGDGEVPFPDPVTNINDKTEVAVNKKIIPKISGQINIEDLKNQQVEINKSSETDNLLFGFYRKLVAERQAMENNDDRRSLFLIPAKTELIVESSHKGINGKSREFNSYIDELLVVRRDIEKQSKYQTIKGLGRRANFSKYEYGGLLKTVHFSLLVGQRITMLRGYKEGQDYFNLKNINTFSKFDELVKKTTKK